MQESSPQLDGMPGEIVRVTRRLQFNRSLSLRDRRALARSACLFNLNADASDLSGPPILNALKILELNDKSLAKVGVEGSNPFARSRQSQENQRVSRRLSGRFLLPRPLSRCRGSSRKHLPRCALQHENAALLARPRKRYGRVEHPLDDNCARCGRHSRHCLRAPSSNQLGYSSTPI